MMNYMSYTLSHNHINWQIFFITFTIMSPKSIYNTIKIYPSTVKHLFGVYQMDIYCDACMNHALLHNHINWQIFLTTFVVMSIYYTIEI